MKQEAVEGQAIIYADRFLLRPLRLSDSGLLAHYAGDARVARNTSTIPHPLPPGSTEAFINKSNSIDRQEDVWALDGSAQDRPELLGVISLKHVNADQAELGYWIAPPFWQMNMASEAVIALIKANPLGSRTIFASVFQDNAASARVLTKAGFVYLGDAEAFSVARNSKVLTWTYSRQMR